MKKQKTKKRKCKRCSGLFDTSTFSSYVTSDNRKYYSKFCPTCESSDSHLTPQKKSYYQSIIKDEDYINNAIYNMAFTIIEEVYA